MHPSDPYAGAASAYPTVRRPDARIARQIARAVGGGASVLNVGAGAGSYERAVGACAAVEPSAAMIRRRPPDGAPVVRGRAEALPFASRSVDVALAVLTLHHWTDLEAGLGELVRVARRRIVVLTWDATFARAFWLADYLPESIVARDAARFPPLAQLLERLPDARAEVVPIPHDCTDGFLAAYWRRPEAYLSREVRLGISSLAALEPVDDKPGVSPLAGAWARLDADLRSGAWRARHGQLLERDALDIGYRLVVSTL